MAGLTRHGAAFVLAAATAAVFASFVASVQLVPIAFRVALFHAFAFALPSYLVLRSTQLATWRNCALAGFAIGAVPLGLFGLPALLGHTNTAPSGILAAIWFAVTLGVRGAVGGLAFWVSLRLMGGSVGRTLDGGDAPSWWRVLGGSLTAAAASADILAIPALAEDRTCHNPLQDGRRSISPVATPYLRIGNKQWPEFVSAFEAFGTAEGWSVRKPAEDKYGIASIYMSVCDPIGSTQIAALQLIVPHEQPGVMLFIYQPSGGTNWQAPVRAFLSQLSARWPRRVGFMNAKGNESDAPGSLMP